MTNLVLGVVGVLLLAGSVQAIRLIHRGRRSLRWPTASGRVIALEVVPIQRGNSGRSGFRPTIRYSYEVGGRQYQGDRLGIAFVPLTLHSFETFTLHAASRALDGYHPGAAVTVYYDPKDPPYSLLKPGVPSPLYLSAFATIATLATVGGMWVFFGHRS